MSNSFCPLINGYCKSNCVFAIGVPGNFGITSQCALAETIKETQTRPDAEFFIKLEKLINKI